ncbi:glycosyltransferase family 2 protein [Polymorphobacter fuscus]|uniref:Glycosyltransferase n=1 Tax=Sandarakinorhabdus fusca TaxID=1439888 RepID=A0A7C9KHJ6_9SPHN|nr:glycosyltransferase [Polymorphobacter fuscus]KAB7648931.1 glycosyltransferase [Polymorphobacter fuscus]MQT16521.1 glycosyltransferase [Polymorphobacter fuscus]NJC07189.1 glycosyltransferase involved in cell wall biosynthesis [Polymorphobacter fuscus]
MTAPASAAETDLPPHRHAAPRVSVIIPHLNTPDLLARCLTSVIAQRLDGGGFEVLVVDNGSHTPLGDVAARFPGVRFLAEPRPGPGLARNRGIAAARAPILAFIDADCRADDGWLQAAVTAVAADPDRAVVGGDVRIETRDPRCFTPVEAYESVFGFRQRMYIEKRQFSVTANLAMAARVFPAVGPFGGIDIAEDLDWGQRAHAAGFVTRFVPQMRVWHPARADFPALARKWQRHINHEYHDHLAADRPRWRWQARAAMLLVSILPDAGRCLVSDRLDGLANRWKAVTMLARIRLFRAREMLHIANTAQVSGAEFWNR